MSIQKHTKSVINLPQVKGNTIEGHKVIIDLH